MCGEHSVSRVQEVGHGGSSPHVRGTRRSRRRCRSRRRIIPACAGNTAWQGLRPRATGEHPRMCGEHTATATPAVPRTGSSPHVRGTRVDGEGAVGVVGIIPACAGNTRCFWPSCWRCWDHPRMCGEHSAWATTGVTWSGSSPHVRGTPRLRLPRRRRRRIIPACAGNTWHHLPRRFHAEDHPRMCGEHMVAGYAVTVAQGSSPHVRGTRILQFRVDFHAGIIPACAGNTSSVSAMRARRGDHPRMCGEHRILAGSCPIDGGSSPHVRGTLLCEA